MSDKPVSIRDVAERAGVSPGTVSNVMNGSKPVNPALAARVREAARELGYQADRAGALLRTGKARIIAVLVPDLDNPFFTSIVSAVESCLSDQGYEIIVASSNGDEATEQSRLAAMLAWRPAGLVVIPCSDEFPTRALIERTRIPYVVADRITRDPSADTVSVDNVNAGTIGAQHLLELGHRNILVAASVLSLGNIRERCAGIAETLARAGAPEPTFLEAGNHFERAAVRIFQWLEENPWPTAILALTNFTTLGALAALADRQIAVPRPISLIGFDDYAWMRARATPLTAIRQPVPEIGAAIWARLKARIEGDTAPPAHIQLECSLKVRASTAPPSPQDGISTNAG
ncbi:LacI family DNA-binding transcriptional regulator [Kaistia nematophila]|uniref:LacI family DNA-binding transcriptional regulator n=1 Tax=Kaistia nematophila TaxID=2994654 RepID=A0A9X3IM00_9HYPH|nr:LacI family DNA-binding transcriptional regulator [Kaistia nematophila]MCX5571234.1 LacI family DNA-binding transcriptional regulator [Kaistia nematophila]